MRISDRFLICIFPFILIFGAGLYKNRSTSDFEIFSRRYWDFTRFISNGFSSTYYQFLIGLTVIINRGLIGGDELVSNAFEFLGSKNILTKIIGFWDVSPPGTPTLTILFLALTLCKFYSILTNLNFSERHRGCKFQNKDVMIENLDNDLGRIVKEIAKSKHIKSQRSERVAATNIGGSSSTKEILRLENSINTLSHISSEITESLYNFISAFHFSHADFPDSNEFSNLRSEAAVNKLQGSLNAIQNNNANQDYNDQVQSSNVYSNAFSVQDTQNPASCVNAQFSAHFKNGKSVVSQVHGNDYSDEQRHQEQFSSEAPQVKSPGNEYSIPTQILNIEANNAISNQELYIDDTLLQDKDTNFADTSCIEYNGGVPNASTTYEFNSNVYSSLI
ncbi:putative integral membrane protein [Cryptosporidium meleagridis]|uniref:Putative integral membrane protein n=1 Tax=Cryptosporidium meleagridis TaxID=93969 RepID=A0A2P4YYN8_9CRYT|nr:putative integral membrane protein [Cryptosporidium meleagridis]